MDCVNDATSQARPPGGRGARDRIERAAAQLFYRNGIHATGVELIAQQANVSKRTLYQHFSGKDELIASLTTTFAASTPAAAHPPRGASMTLTCLPGSDCWPFSTYAVQT